MKIVKFGEFSDVVARREVSAGGRTALTVAVRGHGYGAGKAALSILVPSQWDVLVDLLKSDCSAPLSLDVYKVIEKYNGSSTRSE